MVDILSLLIINPNTTESMTGALKPLISSLRYSDVSLRPLHMNGVSLITAPRRITRTGPLLQGRLVLTMTFKREKVRSIACHISYNYSIDTMASSWHAIVIIRLSRYYQAIRKNLSLEYFNQVSLQLCSCCLTPSPLASYRRGKYGKNYWEMLSMNSWGHLKRPGAEHLLQV